MSWGERVRFLPAGDCSGGVARNELSGET